MTMEYSISLKRTNGTRVYLKSFRSARAKDRWTENRNERFITDSWATIDDIYKELLNRLHRYEQRQTVTHSELADYLIDQRGTLEILETVERAVTRRAVALKK